MLTASIQTTQATTDWSQYKQLITASIQTTQTTVLTDHSQYPDHTNNHWLTTASIQTTQTIAEWSQAVSKPHKQPLTDHSTNNRIDCKITASV